MTTGSDASRDGAGAQDPYKRLGIRQDASFEAVQSAKQARLRESSADPRAQALIESAYDAVLMDRLKERQQGRVSSAARTASQQENAPTASSPAISGAVKQLPRLPSLYLPQTAALLPQIEPATGRQFWVPLLSQLLILLVLLFSATAPAELLLALSTGVCVLAQVCRQRELLAALGCSVALLSVGLILGGPLATATTGQGPGLMALLPLSADALRSLPAWLLLLLGSLLLA